MQCHAVLEVEIDRPAREVFDYLANAENYQTWAKEFEKVDKISDGPIGRGTTFRFRLRARPGLFGMIIGRTEGEGMPATESTFEWTEYEPPRRLAWSGPPLKRGPGTIQPIGSFTVEGDDRSVLQASYDPVVKGLPGFVKPIFTRLIKKERREDLDQLKQLLER